MFAERLNKIDKIFYNGCRLGNLSTSRNSKWLGFKGVTKKMLFITKKRPV
jgi:hypothetical protein